MRSRQSLLLFAGIMVGLALLTLGAIMATINLSSGSSQYQASATLGTPFWHSVTVVSVSMTEILGRPTETPYIVMTNAPPAAYLETLNVTPIPTSVKTSALEPDLTFTMSNGASMPNEVSSLASSPNGEILAVGVCDTVKIAPAAGLNLYCAHSKVQLWNTITRKPLGDIDYGYGIRGLAFSPDGGRLAVVSCITFQTGNRGFFCVQYGILLWNIQQRQSFVINSQDVINLVTFSPDGKILAALDTHFDTHGTPSDSIALWNTANGQAIGQLSSGNEIDAMAFKDNQFLLSDDRKRMLSTWDIGTQRLVSEIPDQAQFVAQMVVSSDGKFMALIYVNTIYLWDLVAGRFLATVDPNVSANDLPTALFVPDTNRLIMYYPGFGGNDTLLIVDPDDGKVVQSMQLATDSSPRSRAIPVLSADGKTLAVAGCTVSTEWVQGQPVCLQSKIEFWGNLTALN